MTVSYYKRSLFVLVTWTLLECLGTSFAFVLSTNLEFSRPQPTCLQSHQETYQEGRPVITSANPLHNVVLEAIGKGLILRSKNDPKLPLRTTLYVESEDSDDETIHVEGWEVQLAAGKIAQALLEPPTKTEDAREWTKDEKSLLGGRIVAILVRLEALEGLLKQRYFDYQNEEKTSVCKDSKWMKQELGLLKEEMCDAPDPRQGLDTVIQSDPSFAYSRARSLYALFLDAIEGPAMAQGGEQVPGGSTVDFLGDEAPDKDKKEHVQVLKDILVQFRPKSTTTALSKDEELLQESNVHSLVLQGLEEALKLRAQRKRFSPLRPGEGVEDMQRVVTAGQIADRTMQAYQKQSKTNSAETQSVLGPKEFDLIGGRIVSMTLRLQELEDSLRTKVQAYTDQKNSTSELYDAVGMLSNMADDSNDESVDQKVKEDDDFVYLRCKMLYAIFLNDYEEPMLAAGGNDSSSAKGALKTSVGFLNDLQAKILE